jgi:hypothetical protein
MLTANFKNELELYVKTGIGSGWSAAEMTQDIQLLLNDPDKLFRRVRSASGRLILSKAAKKYHPGQGVYRSSYQNALRLTATETNMAYRMADYERRQQLDFLRGIRIQLSGSHKIPDICNHMAGDYPKAFVFRGLHPRCFCYSTSIMLSGSEFRKMQETGQAPRRMVKDIPDTAKNYLNQNKETFDKMKVRPFFLTDNGL